LKQIAADDAVLLVHHWDMDGSAAAAITSKILERSRGRAADEIITPADRVHTVGGYAEELLRENDYTHLIVLDMNAPADRVAELADLGVDILIIDHHNFDGVPADAVFVNPRIEDEEAYVPASKICNDISKEFGLELDWIAGLGVIQDFAVDGHEDLFERLRDKYPRYFPDELTQHALAKDCRYGKYSSVMNIKPYKDTEHCAELAHDALVNSKSLKHLEARDEYQQLYGYYQKMYEEIERVVEYFDEEKEVYDDEQLVFFQFASAFHINSSIATRISLDNEDWVHIIANAQEDRVNISARCQSGRVDLGAIMQDALPDGVDGEAGGHRRAAGASLPADALDAFKQNLRDRL
jgi:single-stranded DNA-specific DHH superfamily exonuclease